MDAQTGLKGTGPSSDTAKPTLDQTLMADLLNRSDWIQLLLYVSASVVMALYVYRVFLPKTRDMIGSTDDVDKRSAELLERYHREKNDNQDLAE